MAGKLYLGFSSLTGDWRPPLPHHTLRILWNLTTSLFSIDALSQESVVVRGAMPCVVKD